MRVWQATWGALLAPVAFFTAKELGGSLSACVLASSFIVLELSLQTISRAVLLDSFLNFCIAFGFYCALKMWKAARSTELDPNNETKTKKSKPSAALFWFWAIATGFVMGCAFATKHTGLVVVGVVGIVHIIRTFRPVFRGSSAENGKKRPPFFSRLWKAFSGKMFWAGVLMIALVLAVHLVSFILHFQVIKYTGVDEDSMNDNYRSQLIGSNITMPEGQEPQGIWQNIYDINKKMLEVNLAVMYDHYYTSPWYQWPIMYKGNFFLLIMIACLLAFLYIYIYSFVNIKMTNKHNKNRYRLHLDPSARWKAYLCLLVW